MLPNETYKATAMDVAHPLMSVTHLATTKEAWSSHVTKKCVMNSYTSLDKPSLQQMYVHNPLSIRDVTDQRGISVKGVNSWRHEVILLIRDYGTDRLSPPLISNLATLPQFPTDYIQWQSSFPGGRKSISIRTVRSDIINGNTLLHFFSLLMAC